MKMIKKYGIKHFATYYSLFGFAIAALLLFIAVPVTAMIICVLLSMPIDGQIHRLLLYGLALVSGGILTYVAVDTWRARAYAFLTGGRTFKHDHNCYKRGFKELIDFYEKAEPHKLNTEDFPKMIWRDASGIVFGMDEDFLITLPTHSIDSNIAVFGPPGSGKTSGIAIPNAVTFGGSVLAVDIKGDIYSYVSTNSNRKILRFCPDSPDALTDSCHFDPFNGIDEMSVTEKKLYIESMAMTLIPDDNGTDGNYFSTRARRFFQGITHMLLKKDPSISFPAVIHKILTGNAMEWIEAATASDCIEAKELLESFIGNNERNVYGAYDALTTSLIHFSNPTLDELLSNKGDSVSIDMLDQGWDLYLQISQAHLDEYAAIFTLIIESFSIALSNRPDTSTGIKSIPILMLLDEFPQLTFSYQTINRNLSTLRSKSVTIMIVQQSLSQLEQKYNQTGARSIIGNCNFQIILGSNDVGSSKVYSDMFGDKKILTAGNSETQSKGKSGSRSAQEGKERVFPPEHFGDLQSKNTMVIYYKGTYCECSRLSCYDTTFKNTKGAE